jgi:hypothetical protein
MLVSVVLYRVDLLYFCNPSCVVLFFHLPILPICLVWVLLFMWCVVILLRTAVLVLPIGIRMVHFIMVYYVGCVLVSFFYMYWFFLVLTVLLAYVFWFSVGRAVLLLLLSLFGVPVGSVVVLFFICRFSRAECS